MECTLHGLDVYTTEVDDKGIDFVIRRGVSVYYDVQVKAVRGWDSYVFLSKATFVLRPGLLAAFVLFLEGEPPRLYLIPAETWATPSPLFRDRDYVGKKSQPEWGINISRRNAALLEPFAFDRVVAAL